MLRLSGFGFCALILAGCGASNAAAPSTYQVAQLPGSGPSTMPVGPGPSTMPVGSGPSAMPVGSGPGTAGHIPVCFGIGVCPPLDDPRTHPPPPGRFPPVWSPSPPSWGYPGPVYPPVWYSPGVQDPVGERIAALMDRLERLIEARARVLSQDARARIDAEIQAIREELRRLGVEI